MLFQDMNYLMTTSRTMRSLNHHNVEVHVTKFKHMVKLLQLHHFSSWPFVSKKLQTSNRQDMVFIRPPGISQGAFELRMGNIWFRSCSSCSNYVQKQTLEWWSSIVPMSLCWRSTVGQEDQVIFYIFCIFCIFCIF